MGSARARAGVRRGDRSAIVRRSCSGAAESCTASTGFRTNGAGTWWHDADGVPRDRRMRGAPSTSMEWGVTILGSRG
jgi:hypothetical protein